MTERYLTIDFETFSEADLKKVGAFEYAAHPTTYILSIAYKVREGGRIIRESVFSGRDVYLLDEHLCELANDKNTIFMCHNASFEISMWLFHMTKIGYPPLPPERWHDTMARAFNLGLPASLDNLGKALGLEIQKDKEGSQVMLRMCKPNKDGSVNHSEENFKILERYNMIDVVVQDDVYQKIGALSPQEQYNWSMDTYTNFRGFRVDRDLVYAMLDIIEQYKKPALLRFQELTMSAEDRQGLKPTQRDKVLKWIQNQGVGIDRLTAEIVKDILDGELDFYGLNFIPPHVHEVLKIRSVLSSTSIAKLERMLMWSSYDGFVRNTIQYHGALTGRASGRGVQIQNFPRGSLGTRKDIDLETLVALMKTRDINLVRGYWGDDVIEAIISLLRACIIPREGFHLLSSDYSGIEARVLMPLAGEWKVLQKMVAGDDIYADMASLVYKKPINKKENPDERQLGKNAVLGCGYAISPKGFHSRFVPKETFETAELLVKTYRNEFVPLVPQLWYGLFEASVKAVTDPSGRSYKYAHAEFYRKHTFLVMRLPSGREIFYNNARYVKNQFDGDSWCYTVYKGGTAINKNMWHGQLTNNYVQAISRDLLYNAMNNMYRNNLKPIFSVHDEVNCEAPLGMSDAKEIMHHCMLDVPQWAIDIGLQVDAETQVMSRYGK